MKKNKIIITGGAGFVGTNLINLLLNKTNYKIISIDNYSSGYKKNHIKNKRVKYIKGDTKNIFHIIKNPKNINSIFHFGEFARIYQSFKNFDECYESNSIGSKAVFKFCLDNNIKLINVTLVPYELSLINWKLITKKERIFMSRPNIILIMTDQQRADTLGAWGYNHMYTPSMDRLTEEGFSFRSAYCPGATCVASRAAIFTGMYAHNTGAYSFDSWSQHRNWIEDLNNSGYYCANIGKMHFEPDNIRGGFHERVIVENPTSKSHDRGGPDDDWGRYLRLNGLQRPNDRHRTDRDWLKKYQV